MADLKIEVFTSPTCPHCPVAVRATKEFLQENSDIAERVKWKEMSTASAEGNRKARTYGIRSVPTIILTNRKGQKGGYVGAPTKRTYMKIITEMLD